MVLILIILNDLVSEVDLILNMTPQALNSKLMCLKTSLYGYQIRRYDYKISIYNRSFTLFQTY